MEEKTLKVATWNANGLFQHLAELEIFLKTENIDVCLISETHTTRQSSIKILNYDAYHTPHPSDRARGGTAILIRNCIEHYEKLKLVKDEMQVTMINIHIKKKDFSIAAIYCPPRPSCKKEDYTNLFKLLGNNFIVGGDFNAKHAHWGSRLTNTKGKLLYKAASTHNCNFYSSGSPTYWPTDPQKTPDLIDFFVVKGLSNNHLYVKGSDELSSDHTPVIMTLSENIIMKTRLPKLTNKRTNWEKFRAILERKIYLESPLDSVDRIDLEVRQFVEDVHQAAKSSTPPESKKLQADVKYPSDVMNLINKKRKARRRWHSTRYPGDKTVFNRISNQLKKRIRQIKNESLNSFLFKLTADASTDYSLWKVAKRLKRPTRQNPPLRTQDGKWIGNPQQKADLFAEYLENVFKPLPKLANKEEIAYITKQDEAEIPLVTLKELRSTCRHNVSNKKAPGYDLITGQIIKELPDAAIHKFQYIINACIKMKHVPREWKTAEVIVISKQGKPPTELTSYRPISLLPVMSKIFEKLLMKRLNHVIEERQLIPNHQFGFRNKHSTIDQIHRITNVVEKALEEKKVCAAVFLDVAQAFDKVWHEGLLFKLHRDLPRQYYEILKSYIEDRSFRVRYDSSLSTLHRIHAGVPQGSVLGPVLYLLYTRDIIHGQGTLIGTFADDTTILAVGDDAKAATRKLQKSVNKVNEWTLLWRIKLNESKSTHINFTYKKINHSQVTINNQVVPYANTAKYLGMNLDVKLKWKEHILKKRAELNIKNRKLYWLLGRNSELSVENKILLYNQILKPVWTYGIQLWGCTKKSNLQIIQTFQNKVLRGMVNAPWYVRNEDLHRDLRIDSVAEVLKKFAGKHHIRLQNHVNDEMQAVLNVHNNVRRLKRTKPYELMV